MNWEWRGEFSLENKEHVRKPSNQQGRFWIKFEKIGERIKGDDAMEKSSRCVLYDFSYHVEKYSKSKVVLREKSSQKTNGLLPN